ncbi:GAG-pre-integrase domain [Popillia japonica]|uniref:GAG-pre-integrase domain n=1 Tax=Popillia japonica TaxID=7064 RepID=A0AAW1LVU4_POPJA
MPSEYDTIVTALETLSAENLTLSFAKNRFLEEESKKRSFKPKVKSENQQNIAFVTSTKRNTVRGLELNLLSVRKLEMNGLKIVFEKGKGQIMKGTKILAIALRNDKLYEVQLSTNTAHACYVNDNQAKLWHRRLGHMSVGNMRQLQNKGQIMKGTKILAIALRNDKLYELQLSTNTAHACYVNDNQAKLWHRRLGHMSVGNMKQLQKVAEGVSYNLKDLADKSLSKYAYRIALERIEENFTLPMWNHESWLVLWQATESHWKGLKRILRYLCGTMNLGLFYGKTEKNILVEEQTADCLTKPLPAPQFEKLRSAMGMCNV